MMRTTVFSICKRSPVRTAGLASVIALLLLAGDARSQTTLNAAAAAFRSTGSAAGTDWLLSGNGYVGSFIHLDSPQTLRTHFNMLQPENAGGWLWNEQVRGVPTMGYADRITDFAHQHGMDVRMTGLLYAKGAKPAWVTDLETRASAGDTAAVADLRSAIASRNKYFVRDRAAGYYSINGINESYHSPLYTNIYGLAGVAGIYNDMIDAARAAGSRATIAFNEYGVLGRYANYGEFYRQNVQDVIAAGIRPENRAALRIDIENYTDASKHGVDFIHRGLQTLAWFEYPITLSEFGVTTGDPNGPALLLDNMRLVFGSDQTDGFLLWGFWKPRMWSSADAAALYDANWNITDTGKVYQQLLGIHDWGLTGVPTWTTDAALLAGAGGRIDFSGFYGDYEITAGGRTYQMSLQEGVTQYELFPVPEPSSPVMLAASAIAALWICRRFRQPARRTEARSPLLAD